MDFQSINNIKQRLPRTTRVTCKLTTTSLTTRNIFIEARRQLETVFGKEIRMMEKEEKKEGMVRDLADRVKRGELTPEEAKEEVLKMGVHQEYENKYAKSVRFFVITGGLLCFLPFIAKQTGLKVLSFLTQIPSITFPPIVIYGVVASLFSSTY